MPTLLSFFITTKVKILFFSIIFAASIAKASSSIVINFLVITSPIKVAFISTLWLRHLLRSPSVKIPTTFERFFTRVIPRLLSVISIRASDSAVLIPTLGILSPECIKCFTCVINFFPIFPAGCDEAKSFFVKPFDSKRAIARASPNAKAAVVDEVGARFRGHASLDLISIAISDIFAIVDFLLPVKDVIFFVNLFKEGKIFIISSVSPELEIKKTISFFPIKPRSPWAASVGWIKIDPVPVLERVAEIFCPICPDLPTPIMINLPSLSLIASHRETKSLFICFDKLLIASDSILNVLVAELM